MGDKGHPEGLGHVPMTDHRVFCPLPVLYTCGSCHRLIDFPWQLTYPLYIVWLILYSLSVICKENIRSSL